MATARPSPPRGHVRRPPNGRDSGTSAVKVGPTDATPERPSSRNTASPEDSCAICLGAPENKSFTDSCFHTFCFACLAEWAKVKAECPLCKQRFKSIIHSVRSLEDYDQYFVNELQRAPESVADYYDRRFRYTTTMTAGWREEVIMRQHQERVRQATIAAQSRRQQARFIPRGAITSAERQELYGLDLWAVPSYSHFRESSPRFYRENPACTHRLVPWLNRELNALIPSQSRVRSTMDVIMSLILAYDIRHPAFASALRPFLDQYVEHFVYEFYLFATSVHDMVGYDRNTVYKSRSQAYCRGDPVSRFRVVLAEQNRTASQPTTARRESPQPGPSGLGAARQEAVTAVDSDSDSDSSDCILVKVVKPQRERTPVVIELTSSDDEGDLSAPGPSQDPQSERAAGASNASEFSTYRCRAPEFDDVTTSSPDSRVYHNVSPVSHSSPGLRDISQAGSSEFCETGDTPSEYERPQIRNSRRHSRSPHVRRRRTSSSETSVESTWRKASTSRSSSGGYPRRALRVRKHEHVVDAWETSSDEDDVPATEARTPRKLGSVVVAVNGGTRPRDAASRERHSSRHHRRGREHKARTRSPRHKYRRNSSSQEF
ncbi:E3 ubiquitin-protein ligase Topors-like [Haemaphysalis longicornis]